MLSKEQRIVLSVILCTLAVLGCICIYGFTIGGEYVSIKYILYCLVTSFIMVSLVFLFIFGKDCFRQIVTKKSFLLIFLLFIGIQFFGYQPLNAFSRADVGIEYEVEITKGLEYREDNVHFIDKEGIPRFVNTTFDISYIIMDDDELIPRTGGKMIVREILGGFNRKYFEIVKVTYEPEVAPFF